MFIFDDRLQEKWKALEYSDDEINNAKTKLTEAVKKVLPKLGDYQFFLGLDHFLSLFLYYFLISNDWSDL